MPLRSPDPFSSFGDRITRLTTDHNPYAKMLREATETGDLAIAYGEALRDRTGKWRQTFNQFYNRPETASPRPIVVEIGCYKGLTITAMAKAHPEIDFIGVDITFKRVVTTAQRVKKMGLTNVFCVMANAIAVDQLFGNSEIDGVVIFYPDPWIKKKSQAKNRLVNAEFCTRLGGVLSRGAVCWLKTDQAVYFEGASAAFAATGYVPVSPKEGLFAETYTSAFERRFAEQHLPSFGGIWHRDTMGKDEH